MFKLVFNIIKYCVFAVLFCVTAWYWLTPDPLPLAVSRKEAADAAVKTMLADIRANRGAAKSAVLLHFDNDPTDYVSNALRKEILSTGILDLKEIPLIDRIRAKLHLRIPTYATLEEATNATAQAETDLVIWGQLTAFETTYGDSAVINGQYHLIDAQTMQEAGVPAEVIRRVDPDWVAVQEIDRGTKRAGHVDQTAELARLCGLHGTFVKKVPRPDGDYGLAVLSKEKPIGVSKILMPGSSHTRCVEIVEFKDYIVACTHFPLKEAFRVRAAEIVRLNLTDREKPVFLAGDLNALPESPEIAELKKGFTILSDTSKPTFRADNPSRCIDYILVDTAHAETVKVQSYETIADTNATDHCGLVLKAEFSGGIK